MKLLKYSICTKINRGTEEKPKIEVKLTHVTMEWNEVNEEIAKREAYNGEYTIEDDGEVEPISTATTDDVLNTLLGVTI